jgi:hypothetical protein
MNMNMLAKLVLAGAVSMISLPAMAHDGRHEGRDHQRGRHHEEGRHHHQGRHHEGRPVYYTPAPVPVRRQVWVPAHWSRRSHGPVWIQAAWVMPPQPAWVWVAPQWVWNGGSWQWQEGHWSTRS